MGIICAEMSLVDAVRHAALRTKQVRYPSHSKMSQPKAAHPRELHHGSATALVAAHKHWVPSRVLV